MAIGLNVVIVAINYWIAQLKKDIGTVNCVSLRLKPMLKD